MKYRLIFIGFGVVGQGLTEILVNKKDRLKEKYGFDYEIVAVSDKLKGAVADSKGLPGQELLDFAGQGRNLNDFPGEAAGLNPLKTIQQIEGDILIEVTYTDVITGQPATMHCRRALEKGMHVVTTNKGPAALFYRELKKLADKKNVGFGIEGTVMSGTPVINTSLESLAGCTISRVRGILNGTTNYILTEMERGKPYETALKKAQELGYAEADPAGDVEGWDALAKVLILANVVMGRPLKIVDVSRQGISEISLEDIEQARRENKRWKLIGEVSSGNGPVKARVGPEKVPLSDPLAGVMGVVNGITFETDLLAAVTITGAGAGKTETGFSLLADILAIHRRITGK